MGHAGALDIDLDSIFTVSTVSVVQSLDVEGLQKTLKWICSKLQNGDETAAGRVEELVKQNSLLKDEVKELKHLQSNVIQRLDTKADRDQLPKDILNMPGHMTDLQQRVNELEGAQSGGNAGDSDTSSRLDAVEKALEELRRGLGSRSQRSHDAAPQGAAEELEQLRQALSDLEQRVDAKADQSSIDEIRAQLQALQDLINGSAGLAALSARMRELEEDRAVGLEALEAAVASLKAAMATKADSDKVQSLGDKVSDLGLGLASKADQSALDELRLKLAMAPSSSAPEPGVVGSEALVQLIQGMLEEKAGRAELAQLKEVVDTKAGSDELEAVRMQFIVDGAPAVAAVASAGDVGVESYALKDDLSRLADQVGDMYAEIEKLRQEAAALSRQQSQAAVPATPPAACSPQQEEPGTESRLLPVLTQDHVPMHLLQEIQVLKDQVEMVAHATNILTVGLEARGTTVADGNPRSPGAPALDASVSPNAGKESRLAKGAYARLLKLLGSQGINQKMDHFDPEVLNRMSQKMAYVDALLKNPSFARGQSVQDLGIRELEAQMRKMGRDIRAMKQAQASGMAPQGEGEHAMLAGKPILGYRCMACDRPIEKLDDRAGPHLPSNQMTTKIMTGKPEAPVRVVPKSPTDTSPQTRKKASYDPAQRGPQTWYDDQRNVAADGLPPSDVGPKLAPGGWRSSASGASQQGRPTNLPDLPITNGRPPSPQFDAQGKAVAAKAPIFDLPVLPRI